MSDEITDYNLPETAYTTFDASSLRSMIIDRLKSTGQFTDQIYEGSNMSAFIDVIAYSYHTLLFYLNRTSQESVFTEASIYENVNRIVKLLNYKPVGYQTSTLVYRMFANKELPPGQYTLPRYSYINNNGVYYSTIEDISFSKTNRSAEEIKSVGETSLLYQGKWVEVTPVVASGYDFETVTLPSPQGFNTEASEKTIDHFNVHVYIKSIETGKYTEYTETESLYIHKPSDLVFEKRLNADMSYELKFGNNIHSKKLSPGDQVHVYYLESIGEEGVVGPNFLDTAPMVMHSTPNLNQIKSDIKPDNINYITFDNLETLSLTNDRVSTTPQQRETIDEIKRKAPIQYQSKNRLVTVQDFNTHLDQNFGRIISSSVVVDNQTYINGHQKYVFDDLEINNPQTESRIMYNHLDYASTHTYNNIYCYAVPKIVNATSTLKMTNFLNTAQKKLVTNSVESVMLAGMNFVMMDPVYVAVDIGTRTSTEEESHIIKDKTILEIVKSPGVSRDISAIKSEVHTIIVRYFDNTNIKLGEMINLQELGAEILNVDGIDEIYTVRTDTGLRTLGLSLCVWNPVYQDMDVIITTQNIKLPYYKYPYLDNAFALADKIVVV